MKGLRHGHERDRSAAVWPVDRHIYGTEIGTREYPPPTRCGPKGRVILRLIAAIQCLWQYADNAERGHSIRAASRCMNSSSGIA